MAKDYIPNLDVRVRAEIKAKQIPVKELCSRTGMGKTTLYCILNESCITASEAIKLADALGITTDYLLKGTTTPIPYVPQYACTHFRCTVKSDSKKCCFYCPYKETCNNPCLNDPGKCGLFV